MSCNRVWSESSDNAMATVAGGWDQVLRDAETAVSGATARPQTTTCAPNSRACVRRSHCARPIKKRPSTQRQGMPTSTVPPRAGEGGGGHDYYYYFLVAQDASLWPS